jgi:hypothetical protein
MPTFVAFNARKMAANSRIKLTLFPEKDRLSHDTLVLDSKTTTLQVKQFVLGFYENLMKHKLHGTEIEYFLSVETEPFLRFQITENVKQAVQDCLDILETSQRNVTFQVEFVGGENYLIHSKSQQEFFNNFCMIISFLFNTYTVYSQQLQTEVTNKADPGERSGPRKVSKGCVIL